MTSVEADERQLGWLTAAIVTEVGATLGLRYSADFGRLIPSW